MALGDGLRDVAEMLDNLSEEARRNADQAKEAALDTEINPETEIVLGIEGDKRDQLIEALGAATSNTARREAVGRLWAQCSKALNALPPADQHVPVHLSPYWALSKAERLLRDLHNYLTEVERFEALRDALRGAAAGLDAFEAGLASGQ